MKVGIIGYGWVGKAMHKLFPKAIIYDPALDNSASDSKEEINKCDIAFICVPTPNMPEGYNTNGAIDDSDEGYSLHEGKLDVSIIEETLEWLDSKLIVIRSTVNPGDCRKWFDTKNKLIVYQPEYLGETVNHPMSDLKKRSFLTIGGLDEDKKKLIDLYTTVYNANISIRQLTWEEAEIVKLTENRAIAFKVAQCQELYDVCEEAGIDYYTIRDAVFGDDPRFTLWWTMVFPDKRGLDSKCLPKDVYAWCAWAESTGYDPKITRALLEKNKKWIK